MPSKLKNTAKARLAITKLGGKKVKPLGEDKENILTFIPEQNLRMVAIKGPGQIRMQMGFLENPGIMTGTTMASS